MTMRLNRSGVPQLKWCLLLAGLMMLARPLWAERQKVLVLHSYHQGLSWTDEISEGIRKRMEPRLSDVELHINYLDTKRNTGEAYDKALAEFYRAKLKNFDFKVIIASDNNALNFLQRHQEELFPGVPVVFCGINNFSPHLIKWNNRITGIVEEPDLLGNMELIFKLHPQVRNILVVNDQQTATGLANKAQMVSILPKVEGRAQFTFAERLSFFQLYEKVRRLSEDTVIFLMAYNRDGQGAFKSFEEVAQDLVKHSAVPIYSGWDFYLNHGIVGGKMLSGVQLGTEAARMALMILDGVPVRSIPPIMDNLTQYHFDYRQLRRFGLEVEQLPYGSIVHNEPIRQYSWTLIILAAFIIAILAVSLWAVNRKWQLAKNAYSDSERRFQTLSDTALEGIMIHKNFKVLEVNENLANLLGYPRKQLLGTNILNFISEPSKERVLYNVSNKVESRYEIEFYNAAGKLLTIEVQARNFIYRGEEARLVALWDVTERKQYERELKSANAIIRKQQNVYEKEMERAYIAQTALLPPQYARLDHLEVAIRYQAMQKVGGDFLDYFKLPNDRIGFVVGDVTGHGVPAALVSFMSLGLFRNFAQEAQDAHTPLKQVSLALKGRLGENIFVTAMYCILDKKNNQLHYCTAGHHATLLLKADTQEVVKLVTRGALLGHFHELNEHMQQETVQLQSGDRVIMFSDGLFESGFENNEVMTFKGVSHLLQLHFERPINELIEILYEDTLERCHQQLRDDLTLAGFTVHERLESQTSSLK